MSLSSLATVSRPLSRTRALSMSRGLGVALGHLEDAMGFAKEHGLNASELNEVHVKIGQLCTTLDATPPNVDYMATCEEWEMMMAGAAISVQLDDKALREASLLPPALVQQLKGRRVDTSSMFQETNYKDFRFEQHLVAWGMAPSGSGWEGWG